MLFESFPSKQLSKTSDVVKSSIWGRPSMEFAIHIYPHDIHWQTNIVMTFYHSIAFGKPPISAWASGVLQPRKPRVVVYFFQNVHIMTLMVGFGWGGAITLKLLCLRLGWSLGWVGWGNNPQVTTSMSWVGVWVGWGGAITLKLLRLCHGLEFGLGGVGQ